MRTTGAIGICIAALLASLGAGATSGRAQSDADAALAAIVNHPKVEARLKASKARLVWMALPVENNRACYMLKENHPTHMRRSASIASTGRPPRSSSTTW